MEPAVFFPDFDANHRSVVGSRHKPVGRVGIAQVVPDPFAVDARQIDLVIEDAKRTEPEPLDADVDFRVTTRPGFMIIEQEHPGQTDIIIDFPRVLLLSGFFGLRQRIAGVIRLRFRPDQHQRRDFRRRFRIQSDLLATGKSGDRANLVLILQRSHGDIHFRGLSDRLRMGCDRQLEIEPRGGNAKLHHDRLNFAYRLEDRRHPLVLSLFLSDFRAPRL